MNKDTLILTLGNPLRGDDGLGARAHEMLSRIPFPGEVSLLDGGTPGLETALLLKGYRRVMIIDAAEMGLEAGEWRRFSPVEAMLGTVDLSRRGTLHSAGLAEALALAEALEMLPEEIVIYGVQPAEIGWTPGLSAPVEAALPAVCAAIRHELAPVAPVNV